MDSPIIFCSSVYVIKHMFDINLTFKCNKIIFKLYNEEIKSCVFLNTDAVFKSLMPFNKSMKITETYFDEKSIISQEGETPLEFRECIIKSAIKTKKYAGLDFHNCAISGNIKEASHNIRFFNCKIISDVFSPKTYFHNCTFKFKIPPKCNLYTIKNLDDRSKYNLIGYLLRTYISSDIWGIIRVFLY